MRFDYRQRDPEALAFQGQASAVVAINEVGGKKACAVVFQYRYFPVLNVLMLAIIERLDRWGKLPEGWQGKRISIIGILSGKYSGFKTLVKLLEGAELWEQEK